MINETVYVTKYKSGRISRISFGIKSGARDFTYSFMYKYFAKPIKLEFDECISVGEKRMIQTRMNQKFVEMQYKDLKHDN